MRKQKKQRGLSLAEARIQEALSTGVEDLDLSRLNLESLPASIVGLRQLRRLGLARNKLSSWPEELQAMARLETLDLAHNRIVTIGDSIARNVELSVLDVSRNRLRSLPRAMATLVKLESIDVSSNLLDDLPISLMESVGLRRVLRQPRRLRVLNAARNRIREVPDALGGLVHLEILDLSNNQITDVPECITRLVGLRILQVSNNRLARLPPELFRLQNLQTLHVRDNAIASLSPRLPTSIRSLDLHNNRLDSLSALSGLAQLRRLCASANALDRVDDCIFDLTELEVLELSSNNLRSLPGLVGKLRRLEAIDVSSNVLTALPEELCGIPTLRILRAERNQISSLPSSLGRMQSLETLGIAQNSLTALPEFDELARLQHLDADGNKLRSLPRSLSHLRQLHTIYVRNNPALALPEELAQSHAHNASALLEYYGRLEKGSRALNETKLILLGRGGVGKTSIAKRLIFDTFSEVESETPGIDIRSWSIQTESGERVRVRVWDFGGQRILHGCHQFFLTERTLYLLVLSGREDSATQDAEYWLQLVRSLGRGSAVIVVLNKFKQKAFDVNRGLLLEKYPFIADFIATDCRQSFGTAELRASVVKQIETQEHRRAAFPAQWFAIKEKLAGMKEDYVSWPDYVGICSEHGEDSSEAQRELARHLHVLGVALHYEGDTRLEDTRVLNPSWVTEGIYTLLRAVQGQNRGGVLQLADMSRFLDATRYPAQRHPFLLSLMVRFQLCFQLPDTDAFLVPEILGENQPDIGGLYDASGLRFRYQYEILPESILPRFIVQTHAHSHSHPEWRWRTGVVLERDGCRAVVRADQRERRVDVYITGKEPMMRGLLAIIRERLDAQHRALSGLVVDERVPVHGERDHAGRDITVSYRHLLDLEEDGEEEVRPEGMRKVVRVADLLNGVESAESRIRRRTSQTLGNGNAAGAGHIFISYCRDNAAEAGRLRDAIISAGYRTWWDRDILPGQDWKVEIRRAMEGADAVVLCLSRETEQRTRTGVFAEARDAIEAYRQLPLGSIFIIPVRLSECSIPPLEIDSTRTLEGLQHVDLFPATQWKTGIEQLLRSLAEASA